jgi:hypothetical protein
MTTEHNCPCKKCLVRSTCRISFIDGTACKDLAEFIVRRVEKNIGKPIEQYEDK